MTRLVVFDTETNGLPMYDKRKNPFDMVSVIQVAWLVRETGEEPEHECHYVLLPHGARMSAEAAAVNGIDEATLAQRGRPFAEVCERLYEVAFGSLLAGQNIAAFDLPVLAAQAWRTGMPDTTPEHDDVIDTKLAWVAHLLGTERWPGESVGQLHGRLIATRTEAQSNLDFLCRQFGTLHAPAHDAGADVAATDELLHELHTAGIIRDVYGDDIADEVGEAYR